MINASPMMVAMPRSFCCLTRFRLDAAKTAFDALLGLTWEVSFSAGLRLAPASVSRVVGLGNCGVAVGRGADEASGIGAGLECLTVFFLVGLNRCEQPGHLTFLSGDLLEISNCCSQTGHSN